VALSDARLTRALAKRKIISIYTQQHPKKEIMRKGKLREGNYNRKIKVRSDTDHKEWERKCNDKENCYILFGKHDKVYGFLSVRFSHFHFEQCKLRWKRGEQL
jgi:hypothetical protein